jgi:delta 1-pyrroline-5-carboxylate dehydrogenase
MLKFTSTATGDVTMLDAHAEQLLTLIGKEKGERGVITVAEMAEAITRLQAAGAQDRHARQSEDVEPTGEDENDEQDARSNQVGLSQRAFPLIEMLKRALAEGEPVLWGI